MERQNLDDWQLLAHFSQVFRTISDSFTEQVGIPRGQAAMLCVVAAQDGMTQSEIAEQLSVQGATVTNMLQRMEESGLVVRRRDSDDNRLVRVHVTAAGLQKEQSINAQFASLQDLIFRGISDLQRAELRRMLEQIIANIATAA